jgi:iron complex outermembrane receptor protein
LNLALDPATSTAYEVGMKWFPAPNQRVNLAAFTATTDQEIVINSATGGRTTFQNASKTRRRGFEAEWDADLGRGIVAHVNYTYLLAEFAEPYASGIPPVVTPPVRACPACRRNGCSAC